MSGQNVIAIGVNSVDRININDSTTNFTINLRKSLRNIAAVEISNIVIPRTELDIDANNDILSGAIIIGVVETLFSMQLINGDYNTTDLAAVVATALNANTTMISFPVTWVISYSTITQKMSIVVNYPLGANIAWAVRLDHTALINTLGIGGASTASQTYIAAASATALTIPCNRSAIIGRGLTYNITSARLTNSINTSYLRSLGKEFIVSSSNNEIKLNAIVTTAENTAIVPLPVSDQIIPQGRGQSVSISSDGNTVAIGTANFGTYIFRRASVGSPWLQSTHGLINIPTSPVQGYAVALSGDGNTLAMGIGIGGDNSTGGVYVFTRVGNTWTEQAFLLGTGAIGPADQGISVSLSIDGTTLASGGWLDGNQLLGAVWIFKLVNSIWTQQAKLVPTNPLRVASYGNKVSLSGSGDKLITGGQYDNNQVGAFWTHTRTGNSWSTATKIVPGDAIGRQPNVGSDVSVSADGHYASISGSGDNGTGATWIYTWTTDPPVYQQKIIVTPAIVTNRQHSTGATCSLNSAGDTLAIGTWADAVANSTVVNRGSTSIWIRSGDTWTSQISHLVGDINSNPVENRQGWAVALSANGNELITGGILISDGAWMFSRSGITWVQDGRELVGLGNIVTHFGKAVALSADASSLIVGMPELNGGVGASFIYTIVGLNWVQQAELTATDKIGAAAEGIAVALSSDGNIAAVGGNLDNAGVGAVWIYVRSAIGIWSQSAKLVRDGGSNQGLHIALNANGNTLIVGSGAVEQGVRVMNRVGSTWIEKVSGLTGTGINGPDSLAIAGDGTAFVMSKSQFGADVFVLTAGTWVQQGDNFSTLVTLLGGGNVSSTLFGYSCSMSADGNRVAVGSPLGGVTGCGVSYVFNRTLNTSWSQVGPGLTGTTLAPANAQGSAVALFNTGASLAVGAPGGVGQVGKVWIFDLLAGIWTQRTSSPLLGAVTEGAYGMAISATGKYLAIGEPLGQSGVPATGNVFVHVDSGATSPFTIMITVPAKSYTVFDLISALNGLMADLVGTRSGYTARFDGLSTLTMVSYFANPITSSTFVVDPTSTFAMARWPNTEYKMSQASSPMNFSINNDVLKSVVTHSDNSDNVIVDTTRDVQYRKYPAGYTVAADEIVDIQLRNDRDRIADLQGADWIMTIYATVRA